MQLIIPVLLLLVGVVFIVKGGDWFVDAASGIAAASGIPKFIIGATVVSLATTLPEILVSCIAAADGNIDMAVGNAVGSVTANTGLIMGISVIFLPAVINRREVSFKSVLMLVCCAVLLVFSLSGALSYIGSAILFILFVIFLFENVSLAGRMQGNVDHERLRLGRRDVIMLIAKFIVGAAAIIAGAQLMVDNASRIARITGLSDTFISVTIVAVGTSLPELVTTITAISKKQSALSIGNVVGANIIDTAIILPLCSFISGRPLPVNNIFNMAACLTVGAVAVVPALIRGKFSRAQGYVMVGIYAAYVISLAVFPALGA